MLRVSRVDVLRHNAVLHFQSDDLLLGQQLMGVVDSSRLDRGLSIALTVAAVALAAAVVAREFRAQGGSGGASPGIEPAFFASWQEFYSAGRSDRPTAAALELVEFSDLECPACKLFHEKTLPAVRSRLGDSLRVTYVHFPLRTHRFAVLAASAVECAELQGKFHPLVDVLFAQQDSLGLKSWVKCAADAGIKDTVTFAKCHQKGVPALVDSGRALAARLQLRATPTIVLNGWKIGEPSEEEVLRVATELRAGRRPYNLR